MEERNRKGATGSRRRKDAKEELIYNLTLRLCAFAVAFSSSYQIREEDARQGNGLNKNDDLYNQITIF